MDTSPEYSDYDLADMCIHSKPKSYGDETYLFCTLEDIICWKQYGNDCDCMEYLDGKDWISEQ